MIRIVTLLLVGVMCQAADVDKSPKRPERPIPANRTLPENIKVKHREAKKPKLVQLRVVRKLSV